MSNYEIVLGLEVHVELSTKSKIFCGCSTEFGGEPNTHVCEICSGMPGTLPSLNRQVVEYAIRTGLATNCEITRYNKFDRKNYFYPDLPKAYQISQLYLPICQNGGVDIEVNGQKKRIRIHEIHMEEDAGKLVHDLQDDCTRIDYNRCGVPLLEIVSEPDFRSAEEVVVYLEKLKAILQFLGVSDCKMEQGSMRADINLSICEEGAGAFGTRTEMKNMASLKAIARAIESEAKRQIKLLEAGGEVVQETRRWDDQAGISYAMRNKENAQDYKYFPEPDLMPVQISVEQIEIARASLPELPEEKRKRYITGYGLPEYDADILTGSSHLVEVFEKAAAVCGQPKDVANWIMTDLLKLLNDAQMEPEDMQFSPESLGKLIHMVSEQKINRNTAKKVFTLVFSDNIEPEKYIEDHGLAQVSDTHAIKNAVLIVLDENEKAVSEYLEGKEKNFQFLIGKSMAALKGKANPQLIRELLQMLLEERK